MDIIKNLELDIDIVRGKGYDNGSNMEGKQQVVQKRLLKIKSYISCVCHNLNLVFCGMANSCPKAILLFGVVQRIFSLFSSSTKQYI